MTEQTQTTAQRIQDMLDMNFNFYPGPPGVTAKTIAAEIDRLTAERDAARAEAERLRLPAEAWEAQRAQRIAFEKFDGKPTTENRDELTAANKAMLSTDAAARAREAKGTP